MKKKHSKAFFASSNKMEYISEHPQLTVEDLGIDQRIEQCFTALALSKDVCCIFVSDDALLEINKQALDHDYYTDIITFDYSDDEDFTHSELYISLDRVQENAKQLGQEFKEELHRIIIHGMLHLAGFNDKTPEQIEKMRSMEDHYLDLQRST